MIIMISHNTMHDVFGFRNCAS